MTEIGDPTSTSSTDRTPRAWPQLLALLRGGLARLAVLDASLGVVVPAAPAPMTARPVAVFGFSKGAVVITRLCKELAVPRRPLVDLKIVAMHWVDAGLARAMGVYPTARDVDAAAAAIAGAAAGDDADGGSGSGGSGGPRPSVKFVLHGSPRQWSAEKAWVKVERDAFANASRRHGFGCTIERYFGVDGSPVAGPQEPPPPLLEMHFRVFDELRVGTFGT